MNRCKDFERIHFTVSFITNKLHKMGISDSAEEPELFIYFIHFVRNDIECPNTSFSYKVLPEVFNLLEI